MIVFQAFQNFFVQGFIKAFLSGHYPHILPRRVSDYTIFFFVRFQNNVRQLQRPKRANPPLRVRLIMYPCSLWNRGLLRTKRSWIICEFDIDLLFLLVPSVMLDRVVGPFLEVGWNARDYVPSTHESLQIKGLLAGYHGWELRTGRSHQLALNHRLPSSSFLPSFLP